MGDYPGLCGWALNPTVSILITERRSSDTHRRGPCNLHVTMEAETGAMQPQVKERQQPLEAGRRKEQILPRVSSGSAALPTV